MSGGVPAGWVLVPVEPTEAMGEAGAIAVFDYTDEYWVGEMNLGWSAMLAATPTPPPSRDADVERDAARWRALMSSDRIRMMGCAGFDTAADGTITLRDWDGWHHMGLEVWDRHPAKGDDSDSHGRKVLLAYVDVRAALQALGERG